MIIGALNCNQAIALHEGRVFIQDREAPWVAEEVDTSPPPEDEDDNSIVFHCLRRYHLAS